MHDWAEYQHARFVPPAPFSTTAQLMIGASVLSRGFCEIPRNPPVRNTSFFDLSGSLMVRGALDNPEGNESRLTPVARTGRGLDLMALRNSLTSGFARRASRIEVCEDAVVCFAATGATPAELSLAGSQSPR